MHADQASMPCKRVSVLSRPCVVKKLQNKSREQEVRVISVTWRDAMTQKQVKQNQIKLVQEEEVKKERKKRHVLLTVHGEFDAEI